MIVIWIVFAVSGVFFFFLWNIHSQVFIGSRNILCNSIPNVFLNIFVALKSMPQSATGNQGKFSYGVVLLAMASVPACKEVKEKMWVGWGCFTGSSGPCWMQMKQLGSGYTAEMSGRSQMHKVLWTPYSLRSLCLHHLQTSQAHWPREILWLSTHI